MTTVKDLKLPSDLAGLTEVKVTPQETENTPDAMVASACYEIRTAIEPEKEIAALGLPTIPFRCKALKCRQTCLLFRVTAY